MLTECSASTGRGQKFLFFKQLGGTMLGSARNQIETEARKEQHPASDPESDKDIHARTQFLHNTLILLFSPAAKTKRTPLHELLKNRRRTAQVFIRCTWRGKENHCCRERTCLQLTCPGATATLAARS